MTERERTRIIGRFANTTLFGISLRYFHLPLKRAGQRTVIVFYYSLIFQFQLCGLPYTEEEVNHVIGLMEVKMVKR